MTRLPGVTLHDEQGNAAQPGIAFRGFQGTSVTGVPQGISIFLDGVRLNEPAAEEINPTMATTSRFFLPLFAGTACSTLAMRFNR